MGNLQPVIDLTKNEKQAAFFNAVFRAVAGKSSDRFFAYGGAIRGGKTYVTLFILILLAKKYPGSRWHVIRKDLPDLKATTIPSFEKLAPVGVTVVKDPGNFHANFSNGSKIFFKAEGLSQDPELKSFLGLETNGVFLEQAEELSFDMWEMAKQRTGSWYLKDMPPALVFLTFNPTNQWPKDVFHAPFANGTLESPMFYMPALPSDNPFVTADQWAAWGMMDSKRKASMVDGDWDALINNEGAAFYTFDKQRNTGDVPFLEEITSVHLSFDQNVVPYITMLAAQCRYAEDNTLEIRIFHEYCLKHPRNTTKSLCDTFLIDFGNSVQEVFFYGDASGNKRDTRAAISDYDIAAAALRSKISARSNRVQRSNPEVRKRVLFLCAIFEGRVPGVRLLIDRNCHNLINDLLYIKQDANGGKLKAKASENGVTFERYGHTSDALEYLVTKVCEQQFNAFSKILQ